MSTAFIALGLCLENYTLDQLFGFVIKYLRKVAELDDKAKQKFIIKKVIKNLIRQQMTECEEFDAFTFITNLVVSTQPDPPEEPNSDSSNNAADFSGNVLENTASFLEQGDVRSMGYSCRKWYIAVKNRGFSDEKFSAAAYLITKNANHKVTKHHPTASIDLDVGNWCSHVALTRTAYPRINAIMREMRFNSAKRLVTSFHGCDNFWNKTYSNVVALGVHAKVVKSSYVHSITTLAAYSRYFPNLQNVMLCDFVETLGDRPMTPFRNIVGLQLFNTVCSIDNLVSSKTPLRVLAINGQCTVAVKSKKIKFPHLEELCFAREGTDFGSCPEMKIIDKAPKLEKIAINTPMVLFTAMNPFTTKLFVSIARIKSLTTLVFQCNRIGHRFDAIAHWLLLFKERQAFQLTILDTGLEVRQNFLEDILGVMRRKFKYFEFRILVFRQPQRMGWDVKQLKKYYACSQETIPLYGFYRECFVFRKKSKGKVKIPDFHFSCI